MSTVLDLDSASLLAVPTTPRLGPASTRRRLSRHLRPPPPLRRVSPPSRPISQAETVQSPVFRCSGACTAWKVPTRCQVYVQPADLPLVKHPESRVHTRTGTGTASVGIDRGQGIQAGSTSLTRSKTSFSQSESSPTGTSYYSPTPHHGLEQSLHRHKTATEGLSPPSKAFDFLGYTLLDLPIFFSILYGCCCCSSSRFCDYSDT